MLYLLLVLLVGAWVGLAVMRTRAREPKFLSVNEYWVYLPGTRMPPQDQVMARLLKDDRFRHKGRSPIGPAEGLLMSDIRLHIALVLRSKNPHVFRPDLFDAHVQPTAELLERLSNAESLVKIRYVSETPLKDRASVQLLPHLAFVMAELGSGEVVYDCVREELATREALEQLLADRFDLTSAETQVRAVWRTSESGGWAETRGLRKLGLPELATEKMDADEEVLVTQVLGEAASKLWEEGNLLPQVDLELFGDEFQVVIAPPKKRLSMVRILRLQGI